MKRNELKSIIKECLSEIKLNEEFKFKKYPYKLTNDNKIQIEILNHEIRQKVFKWFKSNRYKVKESGNKLYIDVYDAINYFLNNLL